MTARATWLLFPSAVIFVWFGVLLYESLLTEYDPQRTVVLIALPAGMLGGVIAELYSTWKSTGRIGWCGVGSQVLLSVGKESAAKTAIAAGIMVAYYCVTNRMHPWPMVFAIGSVWGFAVVQTVCMRIHRRLSELRQAEKGTG